MFAYVSDDDLYVAKSFEQVNQKFYTYSVTNSHKKEPLSITSILI